MKSIGEIREISNEEGKEFLRKNRADREHISITDAEFWLGCFINDELVGVISKCDFWKGVSRIKCFYVHSEYRGKGIGTRLIKEILKTCSKTVSAFATENSYPLFKKLDFQEKTKKAITFMKLTKK